MTDTNSNLQWAMTTPQYCPGCQQQLGLDWVWAGEFYDEIINEDDDYQIWFFVCENCGENYDLKNGVLEMCE